MKSNAYQLSTRFPGEWKDTYIPYYPRRFARVLTGPEAVDIMAEATGAPFSVQHYGQPRSYVKQLTSPLNVKGSGGGGGAVSAGNAPENPEIFAFMQAYYQAERAMPPVDKNVSSPVQAMMMMSSGIVTRRVTNAGGKTRVATLLQAGKSDDEIIEELFLASLTRRPTAGEVEVAKRLIAEKNREKGVETIQWVLLNSPEFLLNH
jgi:hypothetical protein